MFVADLELVFVLVWLHEEAFLNVEEHGQVLVELSFSHRHRNMCKCPGCGTELILEIKKLGSRGSCCEDSSVRVWLTPSAVLAPRTSDSE